VNKSFAFACLAALTTAPATLPVHAHFKLIKPASWLKEDNLGGPQKGSPCGPGSSGPLGDDVSPVPESAAVTEVHAGDTITVDMQETIYHPGYFRIALAENRDDFTIPPVDDPNSCAFDLEKVPTGAHDNVLMDGLFKIEPMSGANRHLTQDVKLPDQPCDNCTLQIVQVMLNHGLSSCYYYHCANLKILPATGPAAAGSGGSAATSGTGGASAGATAGAGGIAVAGSSGSAAGSSAAAGGGSLGVDAPVAGAATGGSSSTAAGRPATGASAGATAAGTGSITNSATGAGTNATSLPAAGRSASASTAGGAAPSTVSTPTPAPAPAPAPAASSSSCSVSEAGGSRTSLIFVMVAITLLGARRRRRA